MPKYRNSFNGQEIILTADSPEQAATVARLYFAGRGRANEVAAGRMEEGKQAESMPGFQMLDQERNANPFIDAAISGVGVPSATNLEDATSHLATGASAMALPAAGAAAIANPLATATGLAGSYLGEQGASRVGRTLENYGAPSGTAKVLGFAGSLGGGVYGAAKGRPVLEALKKAGLGRNSMLGQIIEALVPAEVGAASGAARAVAPEVATVAESAAAPAAEAKAADLAIKQARLKAITDKAARDAELHTARLEKIRMTAGERAAKKSGVTSTSSTVEPPTAATSTPQAPTEPAAAPVRTTTRSVVPEPAAAAPAGDVSPELVLKIQQQMSRPGGKAVVEAWLAKQPAEVADQITAALARRQAHPATVLGKLFDASKPGPVGKPGYELARLLGQVE